MEDKQGFIDLLWKGKLLVEHKSRGKNLDKAHTQAMNYFEGLKEKDLPQYVLVSDFARFRLYDLDNDTKNEFKLEEFPDKIHLFDFIAGYKKQEYKKEDPVNITATELMAKLHDKLSEDKYIGHELEVYLVRLLFCLFAEDTGIFEKNQFLNFIKNRTSSDGSDLGSKLSELFQVLNTPENERSKNRDETLLEFQYINGKLFEEILRVPSFSREMRRIIFDCAQLDWSKISPAIFGSLFQTVIDVELRNELGEHYTSEKNILKIINPLFMDDLWEEFYRIKRNNRKLEQFHEKIANLKFFDPACGCGNFLILAYRELRLLEIEVLKALRSAKDGDIQQTIDILKTSKIDVDAFYGIEINEFPAKIAEVSMWMMDHLMNKKLSEELGEYFVRLPLKKSANIKYGNSLTADWDEFLTPTSNVYVLGNPPFKGKSKQTKEQKEDMNLVFKGVKGTGVLDYVSAWYLKAAQYIQNTKIKVGFVSTNSITQGEQVAPLWNELFNEYNIKIDFAHRTFKWKNEGKKNAGVYVIILGFSLKYTTPKKAKYLYEYETPISEAFEVKVKNINPYLVEGDDLTISKRTKPIYNVPNILFGSMPNDGGNLILSDDEKDKLIKEEPYSEKFIKPLLSAKQYLNGGTRWCLWLKNASPSELNKMPMVMKRVEKVKKFRLSSKRKATQKLANYPSLFGEDRQPTTDYILIPRVFSENRNYITLSFFKKESIVSDTCLFIPETNLYHMGILTSTMHMAWVKQVCGRLKGDYRYSNTIVYNNFPWPEKVGDKKIENVKKHAQNVLNIRLDYKDSTLAELYNPNLTPSELTKAHLKLDKEVDRCYSRKKFIGDYDRLKFLFKLYEEYINNL